MNKTILYREYYPQHPLALSIAAALDISPFTAAIALNRGVCSPDQFLSYVDKSIYNLYSPFLMKDMDRATEIIKDAIAQNKRITIYGDYDVDGITSVSVLVKYLSLRGVDVSFYIPSRDTEGYGMNCEAISTIHKNGCDLIITVDTGITAVGEVAFAKELGIEVIVTDHHQCPEILPDCVVINPHRNDCSYPFKSLSGVGVVFKLLCALENGVSVKILDLFGDIIAVGTIADVVDLTGENRIIVDFGLKKLAQSPNMGLSSLITVAGLHGKKIDATAVGFTIAPRINAAGRIGNPEKAVRLLLSEHLSECMELSEYLDVENKDRQYQEAIIFHDAEKMVESISNLAEKRILVLSGYGWHHGIIGIVASRITSKYHKPCMLISCDDGVGKGSGRSVPGFNLFDAMKSCESLFTKYGGHELAAGFTVPLENIEKLDKELNIFAQKNMSEEAKNPSVTVDFELPPEYITVPDIESLNILEPFGTSNPKPGFIVTNARVVSKRIMGDKGQHIKLGLWKDGVTFEALAFRRPDINEMCGTDDYVTVIGSLSLNEWNNTKTPQFIISEIDTLSVEDRPPQREILTAVYRYLQSFEGNIHIDVLPMCSDIEKLYDIQLDKETLLKSLKFFKNQKIIEFLDDDIIELK